MKRLFLAVIICAVTAFALTGCAKKSGTEGQTGQEHTGSEHPR